MIPCPPQGLIPRQVDSPLIEKRTSRIEVAGQARCIAPYEQRLEAPWRFVLLKLIERFLRVSHLQVGCGESIPRVSYFTACGLICHDCLLSAAFSKEGFTAPERLLFL